jgi:hypothetical protein
VGVRVGVEVAVGGTGVVAVGVGDAVSANVVAFARLVYPEEPAAFVARTR